MLGMTGRHQYRNVSAQDSTLSDIELKKIKAFLEERCEWSYFLTKYWNAEVDI